MTDDTMIPLRDAIRIEWRPDWSVGSHVEEYDCYDEEPDTCEYCTVWLGDRVLASLHCIDNADLEYCKEIEEELVAEAIESYKKEGVS